MADRRLDKIIKELELVNAKLEDQSATGAKRNALLRRQASLGDVRDAARDAERLRRIAAAR